MDLVYKWKSVYYDKFKELKQKEPGLVQHLKRSIDSPRLVTYINHRRLDKIVLDDMMVVMNQHPELKAFHEKLLNAMNSVLELEGE